MYEVSEDAKKPNSLKDAKKLNVRREVERPEYLTFASKEQMEIYRCYLLRTKNATSIFFTYEEH